MQIQRSYFRNVIHNLALRLTCPVFKKNRPSWIGYHAYDNYAFQYLVYITIVHYHVAELHVLINNHEIVLLIFTHSRKVYREQLYIIIEFTCH